MESPRVKQVTSWMDEVDKNVTTLLETEIPSATDYEKVREKFTAICSDVTSKEEEIKWLIQQLQKMVSPPTIRVYGTFLCSRREPSHDTAGSLSRHRSRT